MKGDLDLKKSNVPLMDNKSQTYILIALQIYDNSKGGVRELLIK